MAGGNAIRGTRVGAGPMGESERGETASRELVPYYCANGHVNDTWFASGAEIPDTWDCPRCGLPGGRDAQAPPAPLRNEPYKTHLAYVKERRSDADGDAILEEALGRLRASREL
ncbi:RNA polymerase-binding protein RbpA [Pseudonocardia sp. KRD291]|uniref:RNA polymerase-binding protein RbpA n=1 Tax=Pseudonocardia sp. KRD291 TaxID=2792007 RepID=UPI001C49DE11|nr:RNA polymerase-binding protein RbpA [Pseudonocardia sp. KRD291]MBW0101488.1 RNA polymerase-binding protein RbpA [Pseudonocardia sp. KRD291]